MRVIVWIVLLEFHSAFIPDLACDCFQDPDSDPLRPANFFMCQDGGGVQSMKFRLAINAEKCMITILIKTTGIADMEIHWNGYLGCLPLPEHILRTINNCTNAHCSIVLPFSNNNYTSETPGTITVHQSEFFDFVNRNYTMILDCSMGGRGHRYQKDIAVVFRQNESNLTLLPTTISKTSNMTESFALKASFIPTAINTILTGIPSNTTRQPSSRTMLAGTSNKNFQSRHKAFIDDPANITMVSIVSFVGFVGLSGILIYCLVLQVRKPTTCTALVGTTSNVDDETHEDTSL